MRRGGDPGPQDDVQSDVVRPFLIDDAERVQVTIEDGVVTFTGRVDRWSTTDIAGRLTRQVAGVVDVVDKLEYDYDDSNIIGTGMAYGIA